MKISNRSRILAGLLLGICACLAVVLLAGRHKNVRHSDEHYLRLLREAYSAVNRQYVDKPDGKKIVESMITGMLASLDPHSAYLPPEPYHEMEVQISGSFGGVGIELGMKDGKLVVIAPIEDTPASRAGIQANDHIWKIDGSITRGMSIAAAVKKMRGEKGTSVTLTLLRGDSPRPVTVTLVRDIIKLKSLKSQQLAAGYGYIRLSQFQQRSTDEFRQALQRLHTEAGGQLKGLVLDLRYNPGGLLESAVGIANCFIGDDLRNTVIVSIKGRMQGGSQVFNATVGPKEPRYPIIVLINGGSASASEILAGALQDHKRAIIMGQQSFGKGSVQTIIPLAGSAALKLTTARYYTPNGRSIQAKGITPDIVVSNAKPAPVKDDELEIKEKDLEKSLPAVGKQKAPLQGPASPHDANAGLDLNRDNQLKRALELLQTLNQVKDQIQAH